MEEEQNNAEELKQVEELEVEINSIKDYGSLVGAQSQKTQEDIQKLMEDIKLLKDYMIARAAIGVEMTARGLAKGVTDRVQATKKGFFSAIKTVKNKAKDVKEGVKDSIDGYKSYVQEGMEDVEQSQMEEELYTAAMAGIANKADSRWAEEKKDAGRNETVADSVQAVKEASRNLRAGMALKSVKVVGFVGKGLVLFGQKGLAQKMMQKVSQKNERFVSKESRIGKVMQRVAEAGYTTADGIRTAKDAVVNGAKAVGKGAKDVAETVALGAMLGADAVKKGARNTVDTVALGAMLGVDAVKKGVKDAAEYTAIGAMLGADAVKKATIKGAVTLGKDTYKTVGTAAGIVSFAGLQAIKLGKTVGRAGKDFVVKEFVDPAKEVGRDISEKAKDLRDKAEKRVNYVKTSPLRLKQRASELFLGLSDKLKLSDDQRAAVDRADRDYAQTKNEARNAGNVQPIVGDER